MLVASHFADVPRAGGASKLKGNVPGKRWHTGKAWTNKAVAPEEGELTFKELTGN